jgi:hypothetical protein
VSCAFPIIRQPPLQPPFYYGALEQEITILTLSLSDQLGKLSGQIRVPMEKAEQVLCR